MTGRERVKRTLEFRCPDRAPRSLWKLPGIDRLRKNDLESILADFPMDIVHPAAPYARGRRSRGERYRSGQPAVDEWGCEWRAGEDGVAGEVKSPPLREAADARFLEAPYEILEGADFAGVDAFCAATDCFVVAWTTVRPFERMQFLLGTENLFVELAQGSRTRPGSREVRQLRDLLHAFYIEELKHWGRTPVDGIMFMDDWGTQRSLLISPEMWRAFYKPLYREYCSLIHDAGKRVFFHSDGFIEAIYGDLIEIGVDAVNSQIFCMNIEELGARYRGKITFWGEIDRQHILPFGSPEEVARAVERVKEALWHPSGGAIAHCEFGLQDPVENIREVFRAWK